MAIRFTLLPETIDRFWNKVQKGTLCWLWTAAKNEKGYGIFGVGKSTDKAHRIAWRLTKGEIKDNLFVCHSCDVPACVNPEHLFLGTIYDNNKDMLQKGRNSPTPLIGGWNKLSIPNECINLIGTMPDTELGRRFGFSKAVIARRRKSLSIKAFPSTTKFKSGTPHPRWSRKKVR